MKTKQCSICGSEKTLDHFNYGNRSRRSYCRSCNKIDQKIYNGQGLDAVHAWREAMRAKWRRGATTSP